MGLESGPDGTQDHVDGHAILTPFGNNDVRESLGRFNECKMHRSYGLVILLSYLGKGSTPMFQVAPYSPHQANIRVRIHEDLYVEV